MHSEFLGGKAEEETKKIFLKKILSIVSPIL